MEKDADVKGLFLIKLHWHLLERKRNKMDLCEDSSVSDEIRTLYLPYTSRRVAASAICRSNTLQCFRQIDKSKNWTDENRTEFVRSEKIFL